MLRRLAATFGRTAQASTLTSVVRPVLALVAIMVLVATGCTTTTDPETQAEDTDRDRPEASVLPPANPDGPGAGPEPLEAIESDDDGRLVVQSLDDQISTMLPDGTEVIELTDGTTSNRQPAWAPDGSFIAWVATDATGHHHIALDRYDNSAPSSVPVASEPFYLYWDPSANRIAHLGPTDAGIDLSITEPFGESGPTTRRIDRGEPYFMAWNPDGDELLVHASDFRLDRIDMGDATVIIDPDPGRFGAPVWVFDDSLVFADSQDDSQYLVTTGPSGEGRRPLVEYAGHIRFGVANHGTRVVMQSALVPDDDSDVATIGFSGSNNWMNALQTDPTPEPGFEIEDDPIDLIAPGVPYAMGIYGGEPYALADGPAVAIFPSPDGRGIAWFEPLGDGSRLMLRVDFAGTAHAIGPIVPSQEMAESYLAFFDQYDLSHDFWAPSSRLFVYAGRTEADDTDGIWVFDTETGESTRIADGVVASFTHTPSVSGAGSIL